MLIKEEDGSKSAYLAHIGGFFAFVGFAGLSLIFWIINCQCWSKKSCCLKEYHNPQNIRTFWWLCFIFLCGVLACCISGIIVSINFGKKVGSTKCMYERIYYDSKFGEMKNGTKWEGFNNKNKLITELNTFVNNNYTEFKRMKYIDGWKNITNDCSGGTILYPEDFVNEILKVNYNCTNCTRGQIYNNEDGKLICDTNNLCDQKSVYYEYMTEASKIINYFYDEVIKIEDFYGKQKKTKYRDYFSEQVKTINNRLQNISDDLDNYKDIFLDEVHYYTNIAKIFGYIIVIIYYSIVIVIVAFSCFLLWAYSYFKEQRIIYTLMHIAWNILKFFSFSFFMFGAAFGALYLCSRDLIGYNQYLFTTNLEDTANTALLPNKAAKAFLGYCMNNSLDNNNYINKLDTILTQNYVKDFYNNLNQEKYYVEEYDFSKINQTYSGILFTLLSEGDQVDTTDGTNLIEINFIDATNSLNNSINKLYQKFINPTRRRRRYLDETNLVAAINSLVNTTNTLNCGYLKNELQILYDSLYELSIESRISCTLCCCIGFFIEVSVTFYLLVIYHYNNNQFKEGYEIQSKMKKQQPRKFDMESQNEFMDKSKPPNMQTKNKKLDLEYSWN